MGEWFKDWFASEEYLTVYKHRDSKDPLIFADTFEAKFKDQKIKTVLDAACGAGRFSIVFAKRGYKVTGFDLSQTLLQVAENNTITEGLQIEYFRHDIRKAAFSTKFDLIVNMFTSFGYFDSDEENFMFANNSGKFIKPGGLFVLDYLNKDYLLERLIPFSKKEIDGKEVKEYRSVDDGRVNKRIEISAESGTVEFRESVKLYSHNKIVAEYKKAGYELLETWGDYKAAKFGNESPRCLMIFRKY